jgi:hypothetical protein
VKTSRHRGGVVSAEVVRAIVQRVRGSLPVVDDHELTTCGWGVRKRGSEAEMLRAARGAVARRLLEAGDARVRDPGVGEARP